ncbi:MAG: hypothetical protein KF887_07040 [Paracoccaceae bacterium]|nr:MAG: hypothetical protein KF887_07040 [Paracoccaceae bacterium]
MSALAALALQAGLPLVERILSGRLGPANGALASDVIRAVAARAGAAPEALEQLAADTPGRVIEALRAVEAGDAADRTALYLAEVEARAALEAREQDEPLWARAWRPAGMYLLGFLWLWNIVLLHVANAIWRIALPPMPFEHLIQISGLYMGLYMGGHTVKDLAAKWGAKA